MLDVNNLPDEMDPERLRRMMALSQPGTPPPPDRLSPIGGSSLPANDATRLQPIAPVKPAPTAGTAADTQGRLQHLRDMDANPWGSENNHPGLLGKIGHYAAKVGNIAGDVLAPATMANIPGTDLNRKVQEHGLEKNLLAEQTEENRTAEEKTREKHEENVSDINQQKADLATKTSGQKDTAGLAEHGLMRDKEGNVVPDPTSPVHQKNQLAMDTVRNVQAYRSAQQELVEAKTEVERAKDDPNSPAFKQAQQRFAMAQEAHRVAAQNLALHQEQFSNKVQEQELLKPSGQAQSRGSAAQAVIDLMPDLKSLVEKHRADMGPIMGRLNRGEIAVGNVDPEVARLYSAMKSFYALQPAVHGFRNAEFVKDFESALGTLERNPDAFVAGMEGLKPTLDAVAKEGKTSHKRIVEGRDTPAAGGGPFKIPEGAPSAQGVPDGHQLKQNGKVVAVAKGGQWQAPQ